MATYFQIIERVKASCGRAPKTCHVADVKASFGLTHGTAPNRINSGSRAYPCPADMRPHIEDALRHFRMI
jgi:hypothetical protein